MKRPAYHISLALLSAAAWLFFWKACPGHLHAVEGRDLFIFTWDYFRDIALMPGGAAEYLASFLQQFYAVPAAGALVIALLLAALTHGLSRFFRCDAALPLAFLPSVFYAVLLCDDKFTLAGLVALVCTVWCAAALVRLAGRRWRIILALPLAAAAYLLFLKAHFYTYVQAPQWVYLTVCLLSIAVAVTGALLPPCRERWWSAVCYVLVTAAGVWQVSSRYNAVDEEIYRYEWMVRCSDWDGIVKASYGRLIKTPVATSALNLALAMKGCLGEDAFSYYQGGQRSLVNFEEREVSSEILYHLGFVNEARHVTFESMATNPDLRRGAYHLTRLARFNGPRVSQTYLNTLHRTLFYRNFTPEKEDVCTPVEDFFFHPSDFRNMLVTMVRQRPDNRIASEYLAMSCLLDKDIEAFCEWTAGMTELPKAFQEALLMKNVLSKEDADPRVSDKVKERLGQYIAAYDISHGNPKGMKRFENTYWFYFNFR